jgi:hypothetical protein
MLFQEIEDALDKVRPLVRAEGGEIRLIDVLTKLQLEESGQRVCFDHLNLGHLSLFRISCFDIRNSNR